MARVYKQVFELGNIITGKTPSTSDISLWNGNIPFITPTDIKGFDVFYQGLTERTVSSLGASKQKKTVLPPNAVCISSIATIGKMCLTSCESITNQQINSIVVNNANDYRYVLYLLRYNLPYLQLVGGGSGSGTPIISKNKFAKFRFLVEDNLPTQQKIASILSAYDRLIENNTRRIRLLEQMAENIYKEWFVRFRFPEHEKVEMVNGLPKGWRAIHIKELAQLKSGYAFKSEWFIEEGEAVAKIKDIGNILMDTSSFSYVDKENCIKAKKFLLTTGDLTIALTGATIGKISIVPKHKGNIYTNQRLGKFFLGDKPMEKLPFLYCLFKQESMVSNIVNLSNSSSAQPNISPEQIEKIKILGNHDIISMYNKTCNPLFSNILALYSQNQLLTRQRDLLLPRLMSGKLEVKS